MFTGKGGVGKTTCSAATALHYAASGDTLAISTDVTPSLSHIFKVDGQPRPVPVLPQLYVNEIGEQEVRQMWDARFGKEGREALSVLDRGVMQVARVGVEALHLSLRCGDDVRLPMSHV